MSECKHLKVVNANFVGAWITCPDCGVKLGQAMIALLKRGGKAESNSAPRPLPDYVKKQVLETVRHTRPIDVLPGEKKAKAERAMEQRHVDAAKRHKLLPSTHHGERVAITCLECGAERMVFKQDVFQVKRCIPCQRIYRNTVRRSAKSNGRDAKKSEASRSGRTGKTILSDARGRKSKASVKKT